MTDPFNIKSFNPILTHLRYGLVPNTGIEQSLLGSLEV